MMSNHRAQSNLNTILLLTPLSLIVMMFGGAPPAADPNAKAKANWETDKTVMYFAGYCALVRVAPIVLKAVGVLD